MAEARKGAIRFPAPIKEYCVLSDWTLFHVRMADGNRLDLRPVLPNDSSDMEDFHSSLSPDGVLWIPAALRESIALGEQSVMMRVENGGVSVYLRKVFETLGFRP